MVRATVQYCGAGGSSEGARAAGVQVVVAINHSEIALATHVVNHPDALHIRQSMQECNPDTLPDSELLLTSPCCTNHSVAKGQKRYHSFDLFGEIVYDPLAEKSRNTMDDVVRFAAAKMRAATPYRVIIVENVVEVVKWRKYQHWLASLMALGYAYQVLYWNTQFFGVPQSRDRVYLVFWLAELLAPDLTFHPRAYCTWCEREVAACQSWKRAKWGCYQRQYLYRCPYCARVVTPQSPSVRTVLNLHEPGRTLNERKLSERTREKIAEGIRRMQGQPFLLGYYGHAVYRHLDEPVGTITTLDRWALVTPASSGDMDACRMRMLSVAELKACMGFPETYQVCGTTKEQIWQLGNAACPPIMTDIVGRCLW